MQSYGDLGSGEGGIAILLFTLTKHFFLGKQFMGTNCLQNVFLTKRSGAYGATETMSEKVKTVPNTQPYPSSSGGS